MTVYALTRLSTAEVEVRWEKDQKPTDRDGMVWLIDPGAPTVDHAVEYWAEGPAPIPEGSTTLTYQVLPLPEAEVRNRKNQKIQMQLNPLEKSITDRMWREDAVGSTAIMQNTGDPNKDGKTATQYIAWVNTEIDRLRAQLA